MENLNTEQQQFIEECKLEFVDRFTEVDKDYKKIQDSGIPSPPIMFPWYGKYRFSNERQGGSKNEYFRFRNNSSHDSGQFIRNTYKHHRPY